MTGGLGKLSRYLLAGAGAIGILAVGAPEAKATDVQQLEQTLRAVQEQVKQLQREVASAKAAAASAQSAAAKAGGGGGGDDLDLKVRWRGAPEFSSADGKFKAKVRGRLHADYNSIDQDRIITGRPDVSAAEIRRARLGLEGVVWGDVKYIVEADFANDGVSLKDAYLEYTGLLDGLGLRVGNFKTFNSLDQLNSSNYRTFLETPAFVEAYGIDRQIGAAAIYAQKHWTAAAGIFGPTTADEEDWLTDVRTGSARLTLAPINNETSTVHFGASWRDRQGARNNRADPVGSENQFFRYRSRGADLHLADRFIATPQIFDQDTFWGLEGLLIWNQFSLQGEYTQLSADSSALFGPNPNPTYDGWYLEANWFITGERQVYNEGVIGRPKVKNPVFQGGYGAWQLAGRYDVIDLSDAALFIDGCRTCGEQSTWLIGVNWWLNNHTRLQFSYSESDIEGGVLDGANRNDGATIKGFGARAQVDW